MTTPEFRDIERFDVIRELGKGGMGVVYEALDRDRGHRVALKTLLRMSPRALFDFKNEFRSLTEIVHPNLVSLYELFADGERWFFTMELIHGHALRARLQALTIRTTSSRELSDGELTRMRTSAEPLESLERPTSLATSAGDEDLTTGPTSAGSDRPTTEPTVLTDYPESAPDLRGRSSHSGPRETVQVDVPRVEELFRGIVAGVEALHAADKLHRDLKPGNVMVRDSGEVTILDFGLVAELGAPRGLDGSPQPLDGDTTGRSFEPARREIAGTLAYMSPEQARGSSLGPASDWYSMGVMLYEGLAGQLPVDGSAGELLRGKQSGRPPRPSDRVDGIPDHLNLLCRDLLRLDPEDRPGSRELFDRLSGGTAGAEALPPAPIAPQRLPFIGRQGLLRQLHEAFDEVRDGRPAFFRVEGRSGVGKSALIGRFLDQVREQEALVLTGRCYEQESVPYKALDSLIDALTGHLLTLDSEQVETLLPETIAPLARMFPVLERVAAIASRTERMTERAELGERREQAFDALRHLLARLAETRPLVLWIDDLQWGDADSAELLARLLTPPDAPRLLALVCYRSEYVETSTCLRILNASDAGQSGRHMLVEPLSDDETRELTRELLQGEVDDAEVTADWIVRESGGSAYFVYELVRHFRAGLDREAATGVDLDEILWQRVLRLPAESRQLLEVVAVSGQPIRLGSAQRVAEFDSLPPQVVRALRAENLVRSSGASLDDEIETFHDRIRESILDRLGEKRLRGYHGKLADTLEAQGDTPPDTLALHLEQAGEPSRAAGFFELAADEAVRVLAFARAEHFYARAAELADTAQMRARVNEKRVHYYTDLARFDDAYQVGRDAVREYGVRLPKKFNPPPFARDLAEAAIRLRGREIASIADLPTMQDERSETAIRLLAAIGKAAYQLRPELCIAVLVKMVNLCLNKGNTADSAIGYMAFGAIFLGGVLGRHEAGHEFGRLSLELVDKYGNDRQRAEVNFVVGYFGTSWSRPAVEAEQLWARAYESGLQTGDLFHTGCAAAATALGQFMRGVPLQAIWEQSDRTLEVLERFRLQEAIGAQQAVRQAIRNLRGETESVESFATDDFDEQEYVRSLPGYGSLHLALYYWVTKLETLYLWGRFEQAGAAARNAAPYLKEAPGLLHAAEHSFYEALTSAALGGRGGRRKVRRVARKYARWARRCPDNFAHKAALLDGELARLEGGAERAAAHFADAARLARKFGYLQIEALALLLGSRLAATAGDRERVDATAAEAVDRFRDWGATALADHLASGTE